MKKYIIQLLVLTISITLASCDWRPTDHGHDGNNDSDTTVVDTNDRDEMLVDIHEGEVFTTDKMKVIRIVSVENDSAGQQIVQLSVISKTGVEQIITLSETNSTAEVDGCNFELRYIRPMPGLPGDEVRYVIGLRIF